MTQQIKKFIHNLTNFTFIFIVFVFSDAQNLKKVPTESYKDKYMEFEAESFNKQTETTKRRWHLTTKKITPKVRKDTDPNHYNGASGLAYLELLPDSLFDDKGKKIDGKNFSRTPGTLAVLSYDVYFEETGKYYVWVRGYATSPYDNSIHVGVDNKWPDSGKNMYICESEMNKWAWTSYQFIDNESCRSNKRISINIKKPGEHKIMFCMREDGFEFDKWALSKQYMKKPL